MPSRRRFLQLLSLLSGGFLAQRAFGQNHMPDESAPHKRTWMAFIASYDIWEAHQVPEVQRNLATIAKTIAKYEAVSLLVRQQDYDTALSLLGGLDSHNHPIRLN